MDRKEFDEMKKLNDEFNNMTKEQREDLQIEICKRLDNISKIYAENPMLSFFQLGYIKDMESSLKNTAFLIKTFARFFGE